MTLIKLTILVSSFCFLGAACDQVTNEKDGLAAEDSLTNQFRYDIDTLKVPESFTVKSDTSFFYNYPDSQTKGNQFLLKDQFLQVSAISNGFGYAIQPVSSDSNLSGWVLLSSLETIFFNPPKADSAK